MPIDIITTTDSSGYSPDFIHIWVEKYHRKYFVINDDRPWLVDNLLSHEARPANHKDLTNIFMSKKTLDKITRKTIRRIR